MLTVTHMLKNLNILLSTCCETIMSLHACVFLCSINLLISVTVEESLSVDSL